MNNVAIFNQLLKKYKDSLLKKYNITKEELN